MIQYLYLCVWDQRCVPWHHSGPIKLWWQDRDWTSPAPIMRIITVMTQLRTPVTTKYSTRTPHTVIMGLQIYHLEIYTSIHTYNDNTIRMNAEENIIVFQSLTVLTWQSVLAEGDDNDRERKVRRMVLCIDWSGVISRPGTTGPHNRIVTENVKFRNIQPDWLYQSHHLISLFITNLPCITSNHPHQKLLSIPH